MGPKCQEPTETDKMEQSETKKPRKSIRLWKLFDLFFDVCLHGLILKSYLTMTQF